MTLRALPSAAFTLFALGCSGSASSAATAASSSSLAAQTVAAANPDVSLTVDAPMSEQMFEAQILCTTALNYRPCGLVAASDTVSCFTLCQAQMAAGALNLLARGIADCVAQPLASGDAGSPWCDFQIADDSPIDVAQLRGECNTRCHDIQNDAGTSVVAAPSATPTATPSAAPAPAATPATSAAASAPAKAPSPLVAPH